MAGFTACMVANHQKVKNSLTLKSFPFCLTVAILYGVSVKNMNKHKTNTHIVLPLNNHEMQNASDREALYWSIMSNVSESQRGKSCFHS